MWNVINLNTNYKKREKKVEVLKTTKQGTIYFVSLKIIFNYYEHVKI